MLRKLSMIAALILGPGAGAAWSQDAAGDANKPAVPAASPPVAAAPVVPEARDCGAECRGSLTAGAAFYLLRPHFENNPAYLTIIHDPDPAAPNNTNRNTSETDFRYDYTFSPLIWVGYTGANGLGARVRWFHFDQSANPVVPS